MNHGHRPNEWADERISAAYRAWFGVQAPVGLLEKVRAEIGAVDGADRRLWRWPARRWTSGYPIGVAALLVVAVFAALAFNGRPLVPSGSPSPLTTPLTTPGTNQTQSVLSVAQALEIRETTTDEREIAVGGWLASFPVPCAQIPDATMFETCAVAFTWLMAAPEQLRSLQSDGSGAIHPPKGSGFNLALLFVDWVPPAGDAPTYVALTGHFHDRRASACAEGKRRAHCEDVFVVDSVLETGEVPNDLAHAPLQVLGMDVLTIGDAIAVRDSGSSDEIAVSGWYDAPPLGFVRCPAGRDTGPQWLYGTCEDAFRWLMATPEPLVNVTDASGSARGPTGPAVQLAFPAVLPPQPNGLPRSGSSTPLPAVLVGHFNDRRSSRCTGKASAPFPDRVAECRSRFVVDAVAWLNGSDRPPAESDWRDPGVPQPKPPTDPIEAVHRAAASAIVLNTLVLPGSRLAELEPGVAEVHPDSAAEPSLWMVTALLPRTTCATSFGCVADPSRSYALAFVVTPDGHIYGDVVGWAVIDLGPGATFPIGAAR
jgi:hypothetical protein